MATYKSDLYDKQTGVTVELLPNVFYGKVRMASCDFTGGTAGAVGDVIQLVRLPKGARILPESYLYFEAGQSASMTVKVGDADDDDRYLTSVTPGASAVKKTFDTILLGGGYVTTKETVIQVTTAGAAPASGKTIHASIYFVVE